MSHVRGSLKVNSIPLWELTSMENVARVKTRRSKIIHHTYFDNTHEGTTSRKWVGLL